MTPQEPMCGFYIIEEALYEVSKPEPSIVEWIEYCDGNNPPRECRIEFNGGDFVVYRVISGPHKEHARALGWLHDYYSTSLYD